jgi:hypothetical protein
MSNVKRAYSLKLALATLAASIAAGTFWVSQNMQMPHAERWEDGAIAAGLVAVILAVWATRQAPAARPKPATSFQRPDRSTSSTSRRQFVEAAKAGKAEQSEKVQAPEVNPIEAERARLAKAGYSESEISQILVAKETATHSTGPMGSGVPTGFLNNLGAIAHHARSLLPGLLADLGLILNGKISGGARIGAAGRTLVKGVVIAVIAYVGILEFSQLRSMAIKAQAEACEARMKAMIGTMTMAQLLQPNDSLTEGCPK